MNRNSEHISDTIPADDYEEINEQQLVNIELQQLPQRISSTSDKTFSSGSSDKSAEAGVDSEGYANPYHTLGDTSDEVNNSYEKCNYKTKDTSTNGFKQTDNM